MRNSNRGMIELQLNEGVSLGVKAKILSFPSGKQAVRDRLLQAIVAEHDGALKRFLRMRQLLPSDQEDVLQDVYLKLSKLDDLADRLAKSPDTVRSYLFVIASNIIRDNYRRAKARDVGKHCSLDDQDDIPAGFSPEAILAGKQDVAAVEKALRKVKTPHRRAFMLSRFEHKSYREIADDLLISVSTVEKYISWVLLALRKELKR